MSWRESEKGIRRVRCRRNDAVDVLIPEPFLPHHATILDNRGGEPGYARLLAEHVEVPFEQRDRQTLALGTDRWRKYNQGTSADNKAAEDTHQL